MVAPGIGNGFGLGSGFIFGSSEEVSRIEAYHHEEPQDTYQSPLFGKRGLFATTA